MFPETSLASLVRAFEKFQFCKKKIQIGGGGRHSMASMSLRRIIFPDIGGRGEYSAAEMLYLRLDF